MKTNKNIYNIRLSVTQNEFIRKNESELFKAMQKWKLQTSRSHLVSEVLYVIRLNLDHDNEQDIDFLEMDEITSHINFLKHLMLFTN